MLHNNFIKICTVCFILAVFPQVKTYAQCSITDLSIMTTACDDNDHFSANLNFTFQETGNMGFQVLGNGSNYGIFQYSDLPITIEELDGNCTTVYEFIVRDVMDPTCSTFLNIGTLCCSETCTIEFQNVVISECSDLDSYSISFNLEYMPEGLNEFSVAVNGESAGIFSYADLPIIIEGLIANESILNSIEVCDLNNEQCCATYDFLNPCICGMNNIISKIIECDITDSTYFVNLDFEHAATNDSFQMGYSDNGTNTFLGTFAYDDLPITVGPINLSDKEQEILIVDTDNFFCFSTAFLGVVNDCDIQCNIFNTFAEVLDCNDGEYYIEFEFESEDIEGYAFEAFLDGLSYGTFVYGETPYSFGPIPSTCTTPPVLVIQDLLDSLCSDFYNFTEPICCDGECLLTSLEIDVVCDDLSTTLNGSFVSSGGLPSGFYFVNFNGSVFGPFLYGNFTFSIMTAPLADGSYEISINDSADPNCGTSTSFEVNCDPDPCLIFDINGEIEDCNDGFFFVNLEFNTAGDISDSFSIMGNGINHGTFAYGSSFYHIGPLDGDCITTYEFNIVDQSGDCSNQYGLAEPVCCDDQCVIDALSILDFECTDDLNISSFTLNFDTNNTPSDSFDISIDGEYQNTFAYSDIPVFIEKMSASNFFIQISDSEQASCNLEEEVFLDCFGSNCMISDIEVVFIECDSTNTFYFMELDFNTFDASDSFDLYVANLLVGSYAYADLPIILGPLVLGQQIIFEINDALIDQCNGEFSVFLDKCETSSEALTFDNIEIDQYPNYLSIGNNQAEAISIALYGLDGRMLLSEIILQGHEKLLETTHIPLGMYILNISNGKKQKAMKLVLGL